MPRGVRADPPEDIAVTVEGLVKRKSDIETRLEELSGGGGGSSEAPITAVKAAPDVVVMRSGRRNKTVEPVDLDQPSKPASRLIPFTPKTDTHWDFVMKEMMWLGVDFQGERKRQVSLAKKLASRCVLK